MGHTQIARFYLGETPDDRGRLVTQIQGWGAAQLERVHDYIQWLFPLPEPSPVNPSAPVLDAETIAEFRGSEPLRAALLVSLRMMTRFYEDRQWLTPGNHNLLRITRILRSTRLLGLEAESLAFFEDLQAIYATAAGRRAIGSTSFDYWRAAVAG